ncbi:hypothetical protein [Kibdelosporangium philippinense]|uniref:hypothetical protein n=1 Tax=Kibdelosporangium philippinense TaxID=211113 RepID=UPI0036168EAB
MIVGAMSDNATNFLGAVGSAARTGVAIAVNVIRRPRPALVRKFLAWTCYTWFPFDEHRPKGCQ